MILCRSRFLWISAAILFSALAAHAQVPITANPAVYGPYNAVFVADGDGVKKAMTEHDTVLLADSPWTMYAWVRTEEAQETPSLVAGIGELTEEYPRYLAVSDKRLVLWMGPDNSLSVRAALDPGKWHFIAATFDGTQFALYNEGVKVGGGELALGSASPVLQIGPAATHWPLQKGEIAPPEWPHFGGSVAGFTVEPRALTTNEIGELFKNPPNFATMVFEEGSKPWPVQTRGQAGYRAPQDPATMPKSKVAPPSPSVKLLPKSGPAIVETSTDHWALNNGWKLMDAPSLKLAADPNAAAEQLSKANFNTDHWYAATVPGTVLTTLIDRGVYPDPDYGLNNLAIPESLNKQDYWYRNEFTAPKVSAGLHLTLTFEGINYRAAVWLNGQSLGTITGAFIRGRFDVTKVLKLGQKNVLLVQVSPPPHPGIPHEQSILGGPGENGGLMCLDGPTFVATEGWDWIPAIRDRDTGIWQPVTLTATGDVKIGDPQVVTSLPLPDTSRADVEIAIPLENQTNAPVSGVLSAAFEGVSIQKNVTAAPGQSVVKLTPAEFSQLTVHNPRLWWPNGYGRQELYHLKLTFAEGSQASDTREVRFGIREITYELSLFDNTGHLRRVEYSPTVARSKQQQVVDVSHNGMREIPANDPPPPDFPPEWRAGWKSWAASLASGGESSPAIRVVSDTRAAPYLIIKVNGVRIACRGGNWGMDDSRKRVSRERLEPYFRLHHDANVNIIRNWVGQNTEEVFYDLADEYGMLVWNDFWASTQNYNIEPQDPKLFLDNARDTILRFRNHPSIVMWCGRNEGVPQPIINEGLAELIRTLDGTRYYSPSSNQVNLQNSGPYKYQQPSLYYTTLNHGFSVETGTPSFSTLESFRASIPKPDQWPISDDWAYHDWHQSGNGDMAPFMREIESQFGAATSLEDFERKAQMLNYVSHRAIFEGMNAHLWAPNSGRMLWMTQPAWPSNVWEILDHDYDTQASFYGVKKACEPLHVQLDLSDYEVDVVNTTPQPSSNLTVTANVYSLDNKLLLHHEEKKDAAADAETSAFPLELAPLMDNGVILVKLELRDSAGKLVSDNLYWIGGESRSYRQLNHLPVVTLKTQASAFTAGNVKRVDVEIRNTSNAPVLETKLTLLRADGSRILPAYYSDNYVSLLPGEDRTIQIEYSESTQGAVQVGIRGWNAAPGTIAVK